VRVKILFEDTKPLEQILGANADVELQNYINRTFYMYDGEKIKLQLRCPNYMIGDIVDRFGDNLRILKKEEIFEVFLDVNESDGLYFWLMQYGEHTEVISPENVRIKLKEKLESVLNKY
jgi:predicted DNA-binding transcriptional regulator YafY